MDGPILGVGRRPTFFYTVFCIGIVQRIMAPVGAEWVCVYGISADGISGNMTGVVDIERLITPSVEAAGFDVVRVQFIGDAGDTLQVMAERKDRSPVTVTDCTDISRLVSAILDVEDPVPGAYVLEVSSPGIDRPLVRLADYIRFAGFDARLETRQPIDGQRRFKGRLKGVSDGNVLIALDAADTKIPFDEIRRGALILTDELIAASINEQNG